MILQIRDFLTGRFPRITSKVGSAFSIKVLTDINIDLCNKSQRRVLFSYAHIFGADFSRPVHANILHSIQMIKYFINKGYCVDFCRYDEKRAYGHLKNKKYDVIIGQGYNYKVFCTKMNIPVRINFLSENHPLAVDEKYQERLDYFKKRHPDINPKNSVKRTGIMDVEQFEMSTHGILMNSEYNAKRFQEFKFLRRINANAIFDSWWSFSDTVTTDVVAASRNNLLWFGSAGLIHKGLDVLIDAVRDFPDMCLNCYGIATQEHSLFKKLKGENTCDKGFINVLSDNFIKDVVLKHNFIILPSCSEGMATSVATCMAYGIIPIVTKECGFEKADCILELDDYHVESTKSMIARISEMTNAEIFDLRHRCYEYAKEHFSLEYFNKSFTTIMDEILNINQ